MQPAATKHAPPVGARRISYGEVLGGLLLVALTVVPILVVTYGDDNWTMSARVGFGAWQLLSVALLFLLAPLVGWRRRDMWWSLVPIWGLVIAWRLGVGLVRRSNGDEVAPRKSA